MYANKSPSRIKAIFANGAMIEGWAVYGERVMLESGYGDHTAEIWLIYSKWLLRSVVNTILDYSVHVLNMSEQDAKRAASDQLFELLVYEPWTVLQFGGREHCVEGDGTAPASASPT